MRRIGTRSESRLQFNPTGESLRLARIHQETGAALARLSTTGIVRGIYRYATHEAMNRDTDEALARAMAANVRLRGSRHTSR